MKRILLGLTVGVSFAFVIVSATARDLDGRYAGSPLHDWFNHLASGRGLCCSMADGETIVDPDWEPKEVTVSASTTNGSMFLTKR